MSECEIAVVGEGMSHTVGIAAKVFVEGLKRAGKEPTREKFIAAMESLRQHDIGGFAVNFSPASHNASSFVDLTIIRKDGRLYVPFALNKASSGFEGFGDAVLTSDRTRSKRADSDRSSSISVSKMGRSTPSGKRPSMNRVISLGASSFS